MVKIKRRKSNTWRLRRTGFRTRMKTAGGRKIIRRRRSRSRSLNK